MEAIFPTSIDGGTRSGLAVWLPWLLAPAFLLLPIGGCGVAGAIRRPPLAAGQPHRAPAGPGADTVATVGPVVPQVR
jgi:hypothetical protein